jgi:histidine triad (HIT) family protein
MPSSEADCVFCAVVAGRAPAHVILEDPLSLCLLDINPLSEGHCLVIPRRHVPWWHQLNGPETASLFELARQAANLMMEAWAPEFVCMYARGRRVPHTHIFLVPTFKDDVLDGFFNALERVQESPQDLADLKRQDRLAQAAQRLLAAKSRVHPAGPKRVG